MHLSIEYCNEWNYLPRAASLATTILEKYGNGVNGLELIPSSGGVFEVVVNDHLQVFSKKQTGRFPNSSYEIIKTINDAIDERRLG